MSSKSVNKKAASASSINAESKVQNGADDGRLIDKLRAIVQILEDSSFAELKYEDADVIVSLSRHSSPGQISIAPLQMPSMPAMPMASAPQAPTPSSPAPVHQATTAEAAKPAPKDEANVHMARSPFVGTFYRSPTPEAEPFVEVGQSVRRGQTLCIIEAMKLMNEIESEVDGTVTEVIAENGRPVQYGDALFKIKTKG